MTSEDALIDAPGNWGGFQIIEEDPGVEHRADCVYLPWSETDPYGLTSLDNEEIELVDRRFMYCGYFNCHLGHLIIDTLSTLWATKEQDAKLLFHSSAQPCQWYDYTYVKDIMGALGINTSDVVTFDRPTRLKNLLLPRPAFKEQNYAHLLFGSFCRELGSRLVEGHKTSNGKHTYFSRSKLGCGTACIINEAELEAQLEALGARIVYPETMSLANQIVCMRDAQSAIGVAGSALHLSAFCGSKRIVGISAAAAVNSNFRMLDAVSGNDASYFYPRHLTTVPAPIGFHAAWRIEDPEGVAKALLQAAER